MAARGLDFLFVYSEASLSPLNTGGSVFPPLGLLDMAGFLSERGYSCRIIDTRHSQFTLDYFSDFISEAKPRWIGFTVLTDNFYQVGRLIATARHASPSSKIAAGGPHATLRGSEVLTELGADIVVHGEGETPSLEILKGRRPGDIRGISFMRGKDTVRTPPPPPLDMDSLPTPDLSLVEGWEGMRYRPIVITGRGCPYRCTFCAASALSHGVRLRSIDRVIDDVAALRRQLGGNLLSIGDDTFTLTPSRTADFCRKIKKIGGGKDFFWFAEGRVNRLVKNPSLIGTMRDAGLIFLQLGVESGDERVLKAYCKEIRLADAIKLAEMCARERVFVHAGFIIGGPFESPDTVAKTRLFINRFIAKGRGLSQAVTVYLNPFPGTGIYEDTASYKLRILDRRLVSSMLNNCVTETEEMSRLDIIRAHTGLCATTSDAIFEAVRRGGDRLKSFFSEVQKKTTFTHFSFLASMGLDWLSIHRSISGNALVLAKEWPQFVLKGGGRRMDLVPTRLTIMTVDDEGLYYSEVLGVGTTPEESRAIHFCAGKLTGREIAREAGMTQKKLDSTLASLEKKGLIIYRTF